MTRYKYPEGKVLLVGGGIANFTDVAATFTGLIKALDQFADKFKEHNISVWIRRAGPNYIEGLRKIKAAGNRLGLNMKVYGPETHVTAIVPMALGLQPVLEEPDLSAPAPPPVRKMIAVKNKKEPTTQTPPADAKHTIVTATPETTCVVYGLQ